LIGGCRGTRYGCCHDGVTVAKSYDDKCLLISVPAPRLNESYCGNVYGNNLRIDFSKYRANISFSVFSDLWGELRCNNEGYILLNNGSLVFPLNKTNCLNKYLNEYNMCPCPPNIVYDTPTDELTIMDLPIGNIILSVC